MDNATKINQDAYNRIALEYAACNYENSVLSYVKDELLKVKENGVILDMGCGPGNNFPYLLTLSPKKIIGLDFSPAMIEVAKNKYSQANIEYVTNSFQEVELNEKFDLIVANLSFVNVCIEDLLPIFIKVKGWLKNDGIFFANYFEGEDTTKELISDWGEEKGVKRFFSFYKPETLEKIYKKAELRIYKVQKTNKGKGFERITIFARK